MKAHITTAFRLLLFLALILGWTANAQAANCSDAPYFGVIDGDIHADPSNIKIDINCTIRDFPAPTGMNTNFTFDNNDPTPYLVIFDNVYHTGQMSCNTVAGHKIWFTNGSSTNIQEGCQSILIPVEKIDKQNPVGQTTAAIGVPFTYTLNIPVMYDPGLGQVTGTSSVNDLSNIIVTDDLTQTGADMTLVGDITYSLNAGPPVVVTNLGDNKHLDFVLPNIPAGSLVVVSATVVLDDTPANTPGTVFQNTARWWFSRQIDGVLYNNLPGEWGVSDPMSIAAPDLVVTKSSSETAINLAAPVPFTIDAQNVGGVTAWGATVEDELPAGMCGTNPVTAPGFNVVLAAADGTTLIGLVNSTHYAATYSGCLLTVNLVDAIPIAPTQRLIISYQAQLDISVTTDGLPLTNVAAATEWHSANPSGGYPFRTYTRTRTDGTPTVTDHEDSYTVTTALSGYYFQKSVENLTTGASPATTASPGDRLRYRLRLYNVDQVVNNVTIADVLNPALFNTATFFAVTPIAPGADYTFNPVTGQLDVFGAFGFPLNLPIGNEIVMEFEINLASGLANNTVVPNQAFLTFANPEYPATSPNPTITVPSDDPNLNGIAPPPSDPPDPMDPLPDSTDILIQAPGALSKVNTQSSATIGEQFTYTITVPATPVNVPLYDVRILDDLTAAGADLQFVSASVQSGGSWVLTNTGTATSIVLEDTATGIDIPANGQAVIQITVQLQNTLPNQSGVVFNNTASYTYNRTNGVVGSVTAGQSSTTANMTVTEPHISTITKTANNTTPVSGQTIRYSVTLTAQGGAGYSDVFDVALTDTLDLGLVYAGNPTVTVGAGVAADNVINAPEIVGDGIAIPQVLDWSLNSTIPSDIDIVAGTSITIAYDVQVLNAVLANQTLTNSVVAQWTSMDGGSGGERSGADGIGGLNDYITAPVTETVTTPNVAATIAKERTSDTWGAGDSDVRIGDLVDYTLTLSVPEGTLGNVQIVDTLPQGLQFEGIVSVNGVAAPGPYTAVAPFSHTDITAASVVTAGDAATGPTTATWTLGSVNNQPIDGLNNDFIIVYRARVLNNVIPHADLNVVLNNTVDLNYTTGSGTVTQSDTDTTITARQPQLAVTKTAIPAGGDASIDANELVTYTVSVTNSGSAPAYDTVLQDVIPVGLRNGAATITMVSTSLLVAGTTPANITPTYDPATGIAVWNFDNDAATDDYTIPPGDTLQVVYQVQADAALSGGLTLTNQAQVQLYYSFNDEVVPSAGGVTGVREIYGPSNTASTTLYTGSPPTKALLSPLPASPDVAIGQEVVYQITVPGTVSSSDLYDVRVTDVLDGNLEFVSASVTGVAGAVDSSTATQMQIDIPQITAGQQAVIELRVRVRNIASAQQGGVINNTASYTFAYTAGGATQPALSSSENVAVTIVEPLVALAKGVANATNPGQPPTAGDVLRYTLTLTASGGVGGDVFSDALDVSIEDSLSLGLVYNGNPVVSGAGNTIGAPVVTGDGITLPQALNWSLADGNADIDIPEGAVVTLSYDVLVLNGVVAGQALSNSAIARWTSLDGADANERNGTATPAYNDYYTAPATTLVTVPDTNSITKTIMAETFGALDANVRVGDIIDYELRVTLQEGVSQAVSLVDTLPQGLQFEGVVSVNGDTLAPYSPVPPFTHADIAAPVVTGNPVTGPTSIQWTIGDITNAGDNNPANDTFVIVYRTRVLNDVLAHVNTTVLPNSVTLNYTTTAGASTQTASAMSTVWQPVLAVTKVAAPAGGDTVIDANELVTYTVDIANSGAAPAYDTVLQDIIPVGLRNGAATITMISTELVVSGTPLANVTPSYDAGTGIATWNFDTGVANSYTIPAGDTLRVVYQVQADAALSAGMTLTNQAQATLFYSFDDEAVPVAGSVTGVRQVYGPSNTATVTLTTAAPNPLDKQNPATTTVQVGDIFTYRLTVPATPMTTALHDVRILDDLSASAADLAFVSVNKVSGSQPWTPVNTGTPTNLVIEDTSVGIDIPAGEQIVVDVTVQVLDTAVNVPGLLFTNTASYTFNQVNGDAGTQLPGGSDTTANMQIVGPGTLVMDKTGPAQMNPGITEVYTLDLHNTGNGTAWDVTITDILPNPDPGGMCDTPPANITAQIYLGAVPVGGVLVQGTDYTASYAPAPACTLTLTMASAAAAIPADHRLIVTYEALLDPDNPQGTMLTNVAGATQWFSGDTAGTGATGQTRTYTRALTNGTVGTPDHEDAHTTITQSPVIRFQKTVINQTTGQVPPVSAVPGDVLHYRIEATNVSIVPLTNFSITDEVDALNASPWFVPGSLSNITVTGGGDSSNSDANGGTNGTGLVDVRFPSLDPMGGANATVVVEFDITLAGIIPNGTIVLNQAALNSIVTGALVSDDPDTNGVDDPNIPGGEDPTPVTINSAPVLDVRKTSADITGDPASLAAGDILRYTITVKNIGGEDAINATLQDAIPVNTTYVANSTTLNGVAVPDPAAGVSALQAGMLINAPEDLTAGFLRADPNPVANNTATVVFDVMVVPTAVAGQVVSNQGFVSGDGANGGVMPTEPTDDPSTVADDDPTVDVIDVSGVGALSGSVWHDADFDNVQDATERALEGWSVDVYRNGAVLTTATTDATGAWQVTGLAPNDITADAYEIRFRAPGATATSALLGLADSPAVYGFVNQLQQITGIVFGPGTSTPGLNLPIDPDGVVYDSVTRAPVAGATLTMVRASTGTALPASCFDDVNQQDQVTLADGYYKFDLNFNDLTNCPSGADYVINVATPPSGYTTAPSVVIPPTTDAATAPYNVPTCSADAIGGTPECEAQNAEFAPAPSIPAGAGTSYYLHLTLSNTSVPQDSQLFNNHIPMDPDLATAVTITKNASVLHVSRGQLVPYTITVTNTLSAALPNANIVDNFPAGFHYVRGSARLDGVAAEPVIAGRTLTWSGVTLAANNKHVIRLLLVVSSGVSEGKYVNRAHVWDTITNQPASTEATATVRVSPDPTFDCTDVIGKVFDDVNMNGYQDDGEKGIANARVVSARGLMVKTDEHGRFHITCAVVPNQDRGSNFILKVDERSLPSGYRVITENPRVQRATRGKMMKFNFGATIHRVIRLDVADPVFEPGTTEMRLQWKPRLKLLINELSKGAAILRISYLGDTESPGLVKDRIEVIKKEIMKLREQENCCDALTVETEIFWRRGAPADQGGLF